MIFFKKACKQLDSDLEAIRRRLERLELDKDIADAVKQGEHVDKVIKNVLAQNLKAKEGEEVTVDLAKLTDEITTALGRTGYSIKKR